MNSGAPQIWLCLILLFAGIGFNFLLKLAALEAAGQIVSLRDYFAARPYSSLVMVVGSVLLLLLLQSLEQLTYATAILLGIAADASAAKLKARADAVAQSKIDSVGKDP